MPVCPPDALPSSAVPPPEILDDPVGVPLRDPSPDPDPQPAPPVPPSSDPPSSESDPSDTSPHGSMDPLPVEEPRGAVGGVPEPVVPPLPPRVPPRPGGPSATRIFSDDFTRQTRSRGQAPDQPLVPRLIPERKPRINKAKTKSLWK